MFFDSGVKKNAGFSAGNEVYQDGTGSLEWINFLFVLITGRLLQSLPDFATPHDD